MGKRDPRVDAYIAKSAAFARPILEHLRDIVHEACPGAEEGLKWSMPHFMYHGILCGMAAHTQHCSFGFWKGALVVGQEAAESRDGMGHLGRITSLEDLPPKKLLVGYIRKAMRLNEEGVPSPSRSREARKPKPEPQVPTELAAALRKNPQAQTVFKGFSPSHRREYVQWISEAKSEATRNRRLEKTIEQLVEGKPHNWKYQRPKKTVSAK
jgi:uncharacterized protein YdeI (YjbR/CyaY-like superfamily)